MLRLGSVMRRAGDEVSLFRCQSAASPTATLKEPASSAILHADWPNGLLWLAHFAYSVRRQFLE